MLPSSCDALTGSHSLPVLFHFTRRYGKSRIKPGAPSRLKQRERLDLVPHKAKIPWQQPSPPGYRRQGASTHAGPLRRRTIGKSPPCRGWPPCDQDRHLPWKAEASTNGETAAIASDSSQTIPINIAAESEYAGGADSLCRPHERHYVGFPPMLITLLGMAAAALTSLSYVPQVRKALPRGSTDDLSFRTSSFWQPDWGFGSCTASSKGIG
jgi:hypothetical protein